jgi:hypothetical protein
VRKPKPDLEVFFSGDRVYPELIPIRAVADALAAIHRLGLGEDLEEESDASTLRLLDVIRGSATFRCVASDAKELISGLRRAGPQLELAKPPDRIAGVLRSIQRLSEIARSLDCTIEVRTPGAPDDVIARIVPDSYQRIAGDILLEGQTSIPGNVQRVGGAIERRCALRVDYQSKLLFCDVESDAVARKLGQLLYEDVVIDGTATWVRNSWRIFQFRITDVHRPEHSALQTSFEAMRNAGGRAWDQIKDPAAFLDETTGPR